MAESRPSAPVAGTAGSRRRRLRGWALALLLAFATPADAAVTVHSRSGQFVVQSPQATPPSLARVTPPSTNSVLTLHPDPLAVSGERIKTAVLAELGCPDRWQGKIFLSIDPRGRPGSPITPVARQYGDGWQYSLRLPQEVEGTALIRGLVHVLLLELANRNPGPHVPEIPVWLIEALTGQVLSRVGPDPLAKPNRVSGKYGNAIGQLTSTLSERGLADEDRKVLDLALSRMLPSFEELSLPAVERLGGAELDRYRACCQLLFVSLRQLPQGNQLLVGFLGQLPRHLNWQTAFLSAYGSVFARFLDIEKWWALTAQRVNIARGRTLLPGHTGLAWLGDLAGFEVEVRDSAQAPVRRERVTLQRVIADWGFSRQVPVLNARGSQFRRLAPNLPGDLRVLAEGYADTLSDYVGERTRLGYQPGLPGQTAAALANIMRTTLGRLDTLDARRQALAPAPPPATAGPPSDATPDTAPGAP
jgi:hypothetical protein